MKAIVALHVHVSAKGKSTTEKMVSDAGKTLKGSQIGLPFQKCTCYCKTK
jgi:hypothetical protein